MAKAGEIMVSGAFYNLCDTMPGISFQELANPPAGTGSAYRVIPAA